MTCKEETPTEVTLKDTKVPSDMATNQNHFHSNQSIPLMEIKDVNGTAGASRDAVTLSRNGQYRTLQCDDLSADICHHLLIILAEQNQVRLCSSMQHI